ELYVIKMILKYDRDEIEIEEIIEAIEALLLEDPINEGAIEDKLEELKETYLWYQFIDKVELIIAGCGDLNTTLTAKIERYISADNPNHRKEIEELIEEFQELCDAQKRYDDLVYEIEEFLEGDLTGFGDRDTYDSFMDTFNDWNDLVDPDYAELLEAIGVLEALLDYLDDMFTIDEGSSFLNRYKEHMRNIVENSEFETGEGFGLYFPIVETTFDGYIAEIDGLTNPELFDIILIISEVKEFLDIYEDMRYVTLLENDDYIAKRAEVLGLTSEIGALDDEDLDLLFEEFVSLTDDLDVVDYITLAQYNDFVEKYDELKAIYSSF
ncbi:MAG: hypothetical protein KAH05_09010, partial [Clostridiales bacterium]|nr:hypothetical protein [Clostridiales bacterium]